MRNTPECVEARKEAAKDNRESVLGLLLIAAGAGGGVLAAHVQLQQRARLER